MGAGVTKKEAVLAIVLCSLTMAPPVFAAPATPAEPIDLASWITADDYPVDAMRDGAEGTVWAELSVDNEGHITRCDVLETSGVPSLDRAACAAIIKRGHFKPALDGNGKPVASRYSRRVAWHLPKVPLLSYSYVTSFIIGPDRSIVRCEHRQSPGFPMVDPCEQQGAIHPLGQIAQHLGPGIATMTSRQMVDDVLPVEPSLDGLSLPPLATKEEYFTVDAAGAVTECRAFSASAATERCDRQGDRYAPASNGNSRHVKLVTGMAFEPAATPVAR